jgi:hypothetical protein
LDRHVSRSGFVADCFSAPGLPVRILRLESLLRMKTESGRAQDLADIDELSLLHGRKSSYDR